MSGAAIDARPLAGWARGFYGKLPAHGDFVQAGLPRDFVAAWDGWIARVLPASRERFGAAWLDAWLEAPVWRFALSPGTCGKLAAVGAWMPSVDAVGRYFPLVLAACGEGEAARAEVEAFVEAEVQAGRAALADGAGAAALVDSLSDPARRADDDPPHGTADCAGALAGAFGEGAARWWTDGAPRVRAVAFATPELPDERTFAAMLNDGAQA